jgi:hypothetical protein
MTAQRLSPLDASFLAVEGPTAHMHVGWEALFAAPALPRRTATWSASSDRWTSCARS